MVNRPLILAAIICALFLEGEDCFARKVKPIWVRGIVADSDTKLPISGVWVSLPRRSYDKKTYDSGQTDDNGEFALKVPPAPTLRFYHPDYTPLNRRAFNPDPDGVVDTIYLKRGKLLDLVGSGSTSGDCACEAIGTREIAGSLLSSLTECEQPENTSVSPRRDLRTLYGRAMTEDRHHQGQDTLYVKYDGSSGLLSELRGGNIRVSEFSSHDTVSRDNGVAVTGCFLRQNASFLGLSTENWRVVSANQWPEEGEVRETRVQCKQVIGQVLVHDSWILLTFSEDQLIRYKGRYQPVGSLDLEPSISSDIAFLRGKATQERHLAKLGYPGCTLQCNTVELRVYHGEERHPEKPRLVWVVECCRLKSPTIAPTLIIDAHSGKLIRAQYDRTFCIHDDVKPFMFYGHGD